MRTYLILKIGTYVFKNMKAFIQIGGYIDMILLGSDGVRVCRKPLFQKCGDLGVINQAIHPRQLHCPFIPL